MYRNMKAKARDEKRVNRTIRKFRYILEGENPETEDDRRSCYEKIMRAKRVGLGQHEPRGNQRAKEKTETEKIIYEEIKFA